MDLDCGHRSRPLRAGFLLGMVLWCMLGCTQATLTLYVTIAPDANFDYPVAMSVVIVYDKAIQEKLLAISAEEWLKQRKQFVRDHRNEISEEYWELLPGQQILPIIRELRPNPVQGIIYAWYRSPGAHRYLFDPERAHSVEFGPKSIYVSP